MTSLKFQRTNDLAESHDFRVVIASTREMTPRYFTPRPRRYLVIPTFLLGFRLVQRYGMIVGGIDPHRFDLLSTHAPR